MRAGLKGAATISSQVRVGESGEENEALIGGQMRKENECEGESDKLVARSKRQAASFVARARSWAPSCADNSRIQDCKEPSEPISPLKYTLD